MNKKELVLLLIVSILFFFSGRAEAAKSPENYFSEGSSAFAGKNYREAARQFEKALKVNPEDANAYYYLGNCYFYLGNQQKAEECLQKAVELDPELKGAIEVLIAEMREKASGETAAEKKWAVSGTFGMEYDDNVVLNPSGVATAISDQEDWRGVFNLNLEYRPIKEPLEFTTFYKFYQSWHQKLTDYNLQGHTIGLRGSVKKEPWRFRLQYSYNYYYLAHNDYLAIHSIIPTANFVQEDKLTQFYYQFQNKDYLQSVPGATNQDAGNNIFGINQYFFFKNNSYLKVGYSYEDNDARGRNWDYGGHYLLLSGLCPLTENLKLKLGFIYNPTRYKNVDSVYIQKRKDNEMTYNLTLTQKLNESLNLSLGYTYIDNDSNIANCNYQRSIYSLRTEFSF